MLLYYTRPREAGIWTVPVSGGRETRIPDFDAIDLSQTWTVKRQGLYFAARDVDRRMRFFLFDLATRRKHPLTEAFSESLYGGIDASPDGRWILAGKSSPPKADIILVENFR
jgi:Tol biopolymer transport system component